ncbi:MAG: O-antigen ligase family protein [Blastocatellia bacterium]
MKLLSASEIATPDAPVRRAPDERGAAGREPAARERVSRGAAFIRGMEGAVKRRRHRLAYAGVALFTLLLYLRPNEMFPQVFGTFPLAKIVGLVMLAAYLLSRLYWGEKITILPIELKMAFLIYLLGWLHTPFAVDPASSVATLTDTYLKVVLVFMLMINLLGDRKRLLLIMKLIVICGSVLAIGAIRDYATGNMAMMGIRIEGMVGGIFGNPNDLATSLGMIIPLAVILVMTQRGIWRFICLVSIPVMALGVALTFSRGGFLGLMLGSGVILWKLGEKNRARTVVLSLLVVGVLALAIPSNYSERLSTIVENNKDKTGSANERKEVMYRAISIAVHRPVIGVGMSNFPRYSIHEMVAHNSYFEIAAELGLAGLIFYLIMIIAPLRSCQRIEQQTKPAGDPEGKVDRSPAGLRRRELYLLSVALQATLYVYLLCSFFASIQYLWFVYYPIAYVVGLRTIKAIEESQEVEAGSPISPVQAPETRLGGGPRSGALWKSNQSRQKINGTEISGQQSPARKVGRLFAKR